MVTDSYIYPRKYGYEKNKYVIKFNLIRRPIYHVIPRMHNVNFTIWKFWNPQYLRNGQR